MKKEFLFDSLVALIAFTFCTIFWQERMGLNALIFALLLVACLVLRYDVRQQTYFWLTATGTIIAAVMVVWHNSLVSKIIYFSSMISMIGFAQHRVLRFVWYAWLMGAYSMSRTPKFFARHWQENLFPNFQPFFRFRNVQLAFIPFLVFGVFYIIYYHANGQFAVLSDLFWYDCWQFILAYFPLQRLLLFVVGFLVAGGALWKSKIPLWIQRNQNKRDDLSRYTDYQVPVKFGMLSLKREYQQAIAILLTLNALLFIVNVIDVRYVWFDFAVGTAQQMKQYVHEGTYLLIVAILLAMSILLFFFRGKLNFFSRNRWIKSLAYVWIAQNAILTLSVAMRNYRYVEHYNLAYKRIGVFIFLFLVLFGLVTLVFKIKDRKTLYYALRHNALASYCIWIMVCCINWDVLITRYNLNHAENGVDTEFLIEKVSDKNLFILEDNENKLIEYNISEHYSDRKISSRLDQKRSHFKHRTAKGTWLSWNYSDWRNR